MTLILCSSNTNKAREISQILNIDIVTSDIYLDEIQSVDTAEVCRKKAHLASIKFPEYMPNYDDFYDSIIVDDTGLELSSLNGFPGALVKFALDSGGPELLFRMIPSGGCTKATAVTSIAIVDKLGVHVFTGRVDGIVIPKPSGVSGFGYDNVFVPNATNKTLADMSTDEKNKYSPRAIALKKLLNHINSNTGV